MSTYNDLMVNYRAELKPHWDVLGLAQPKLPFTYPFIASIHEERLGVVLDVIRQVPGVDYGRFKIVWLSKLVRQVRNQSRYVKHTVGHIHGKSLPEMSGMDRQIQKCEVIFLHLSIGLETKGKHPLVTAFEACLRWAAEPRSIDPATELTHGTAAGTSPNRLARRLGARNLFKPYVMRMPLRARVPAGAAATESPALDSKTVSQVVGNIETVVREVAVPSGSEEDKEADRAEEEGEGSMATDDEEEGKQVEVSAGFMEVDDDEEEETEEGEDGSEEEADVSMSSDVEGEADDERSGKPYDETDTDDEQFYPVSNRPLMMRSGWERQCWNALRDVEVDVRTDREIKRIHDATGHDTTEDEWDLLQSRYKKEVEDEANTASGRARRDLEKPYVARRVSYIEWRGQQPSQRHKSVVSWARRIHHKLARQIEDQERTRRQEEQKIRLEETTAAVAETVAMRRSLVVISKLSRELQEMPSQQQIPEQLAAAGEGQNIRWLQLSDLARTREIIMERLKSHTDLRRLLPLSECLERRRQRELLN